MTRALWQVGNEIALEWPKPYFGAVPFIRAMRDLTNIDDTYGAESASSIVRYFLANASTWRGPAARRIKAELKDMLK